MKKRVDLTEQDINDYIAGTTLQEIASRYFVSRHTITRKMRETGREDVRALIKERAVNGACKLSEAQIAEAIMRVNNSRPSLCSRGLHAISSDMESDGIRNHAELLCNIAHWLAVFNALDSVRYL